MNGSALTALCAFIALAILAFAALAGYAVGHARKVRAGEDYNAGKAEGYRLGLVKGEHLRDALHAEVDRLNEALDHRYRGQVDAAYEDAREVNR